MRTVAAATHPTKWAMEETRTAYDDSFFDAFSAGAVRSARRVVPLLLQLVNVQSVLDIGCGRGEWLSVFQENGVKAVHGVDGAYVNPTKLCIDRLHFEAADLSKPFAVKGVYDLVLCLETAEHLPLRAARPLVRTLVAAAPLVLFSAAIPGQGGVHHINEQWPCFWKALFDDQGFRRLDPIRPRIWLDESVEWWYRQNLYLFANSEALDKSTRLQEEANRLSGIQLECVNETILNRYASFGGLLKELPGAARRALWRRLPWNR